jgi:hypothetical protein
MHSKIYFIENFHGIQYFLSVINPSEDNIVVTTGNKYLEKFLDDILPDQRRTIIPRIPCYRFSILPFLLLVWRIRYSSAISKLKSSEAYYFSKGSNIHFFSVFRSLQNRGCNLHFIDGSGGRFNEELIREGNVLQKVYNAILSICCGQHLARYKCRLWTHFGLRDYPIPEDITLLDWEAIAEKFKISKEKVDNAILIVDGPIQDIPGVDIDKTQYNLIKYFSYNFNKAIHLKPHISYSNHSFLGTSFENNIKILPKHMPAELISLKYDDIYFFSSATCYANNKKNLYTLSKLLVFESKDDENNYWNLYNDYFSNINVNMITCSK